MTQDRLWNFVCAVGLVVVAAVWLWLLFAYAELIFRHQTNEKPMQQQPIPSLWPSIVVLAGVVIVAAGAPALIGWIALALLGY